MIAVLILAAVQGVAEFLPISSSLHLSFVAKLFLHGLDNRELQPFFILLNVGTMCALVSFYWKDVIYIVSGFFDFILCKISDRRRLFMNIAVASIPTIILFGCVECLFGGQNFSYSLMLIALIAFSFVILLSDKYSKIERCGYPSSREWWIVGLTQMLSIVPGVSRLGTNYVAFRMLRFNRVDSYKYSMLFSIVPVCGALTLNIKKIYCFSLPAIGGTNLIFCVFVAFICGLFAVYVINKFLAKHSFAIFAWYRLFIGVFLL